jgi:hypothetical protein
VSRELSKLVPYEVAIVLAIALLPLPAAIPIALPLVIAASISRAIRRRPWSEVSHGGISRLGLGLLAGAIALGVALLAGSQSLHVLYSGQAGEHIIAVTDLASSSAQPGAIAIGVVAIGLVAFATELALRGWIVERVLELSPGSPILPVLIGAFVEALITRGDPQVRLAAIVFGAGLGWLYIAGKRSVIAPAWARIVFQCGAFLLEALRVV